MLRAFLLVGMGGFAGSAARYAVGLMINRTEPTGFPLATFIINLAGCFLIGILSGLAVRNNWMQQDGWLVLATGFCGGFTTFSTFALEQNNLLSRGAYLTTVLYAGLSLMLGLLLCKAGMWLAGPKP
ncbi:MAG: fluoride efflux transporter CrcB [Sphingobacteriales bacterium]|nr:MAG: fluoride efflux transporter CrcB [Sphingobacteriales bacterium]